MRKPRIALALAGVLCLGALATLPTSAATAEPPNDGPAKSKFGTPLAPRLQELNDNPKMSRREVADETSTAPSGPGSLLRYDATRYLVDIRVKALTDKAANDLTAAGAIVTHRATDRRVITAAVEPARFDEVAAVDGVEYIAEILTPMTNATCPGPGGSQLSEGDATLKANQLRGSLTDPNGDGIKVGILSDSYNRAGGTVTADTDIVSGDLPGALNPCGHPTGVTVVDDVPVPPVATSDEGRAMAQIVHDLAPFSSLYFADAFSGEEAFATSIQTLATTHAANVIVDDITYFDEPMFQEGVIANAVTSVTSAGVHYFSSAGNSNIKLGTRNAGSYEAPSYRATTTCPAASYTFSVQDCHNFNGTGVGAPDGDFAFTLNAEKRFTLAMQWAQPESGVTTDLDLYLLDGTTNAILASSVRGNLSFGKASEVLSFTNGATSRSLRIVIGRYAGAAPTKPIKFVFFNGSSAISAMDPVNAPDVEGATIFGHNGGINTVSVAASDVRPVTSTVNAYSSRGPVTLLFDPVSGTTPAAAKPAPQVISKPDLTASDCNRNTFFGTFDTSSAVWRFCGTSAAAPHAAAVAALLKDLVGGATPAQITAAMKATAFDLGAAPLVQGAGLVQAIGAGNNLVRTAQTISFLPPPTGIATGTALLAATASSMLPVTLTVDAGSTAICSLAANTVTYLRSGYCTINADQPGNGTFAAAPQVRSSILVSKTNQTIAFDAPASGMAGGTAALTASATSALAVTLAATAGSAGICTVSGVTVFYIGAGNCVINANQGGDGTYNPAPQVQDTIVVTPAPAVLISSTSSCNGEPTTQVGTPGNDVIVGTPGRDVIDGMGGSDQISGLGGDDIMCNTGGSSLVADGGRGRDLLIGTDGSDVLFGRAGNDALVGHGGNDDLRGGNGRDGISGGDGNDVLRGGKDDDILDGGAGADVARGGPGRDSIRSATGR